LAVTPFERIGLLDRPGIALANLLRVDPKATFLAMVAPDRLTPKERRSFSAQFLKEARKNIILKTILDTATNPFVVIGVLASVVAPPIAPEAFGAAGIADKYGAMGRAMNPLLAKISSHYSLFLKTKISPTIEKIVLKTAQFMEKWSVEKFGKAFKENAKEYGQGLSKLSQYKIFGKMEGLDSMKGYLARTYHLPRPLGRNLKLLPVEEGARSKLVTILSEIEGEWRKLPDRTRKALERRMRDAHKVVRGKSLDFYAPHTLAKEGEFVQAALRSQLSMTTEMPQQVQLRRLMDSIDKLNSPHWIPRRGRMIPHAGQLALLEKEGFIDPEMRELLFAKLKHTADWGRQTLMDAAARYVPEWKLAEMDPKAAAKILKENKKILKTMQDVLVGKRVPKSLRKRISFVKQIMKKSNMPMEDLAQYVGDASYGEYYFTEGPAKDLPKWSGFSWSKTSGEGVVGLAKDALERGDLVGAQKVLRGAISDTGNALPYTMDLADSLGHYVNSLSHEWGFSVAGPAPGISYGDILAQEGRKLAAAGLEGNAAAAQRYKILMEDYIPVLRGVPMTDRSAAEAWWRDLKLRGVRWLESPTAVKLLGEKTAKKVHDYYLDGLATRGGAFDPAGYFYLTTLGLNPSPAIKNLLQVGITTGPLLGVGAILKGYKRLAPKINKYLELRLGGMKDGPATKIAFADYLERGLPMDPITKLAVPEHMVETGNLDELKRKAMALFMHSERHNRLLTYEAGTAYGLERGLSEAAAKEFGASMIGPTQFFGGPAGAPLGLMRMAPWARQFMQFPLRYLEFLRLSTQWGSAATGGRQWGTLARVAGTSAAIYTVTKNVAGIDLTPGLLSGALPLPSFPGMPFYPLPFVPPTLSVVGSGIQALAEGTTKPLGQAAALAIPGGIMGRRAWKALSPKYADYTKETPDGRVPTYNDAGLLVGYRTKTDMVLKAIGFTPSEQKTEQEFVHYLLTQRDQIREYRKKYLEAILQNNYGRAARINEEFKRRYPALGGIQLKQGDFTAMQYRTTHTRLSRILRGFPRAYRPQFEQIAATTLAPGFFGPEGISPTLGLHYTEMGRLGGGRF